MCLSQGQTNRRWRDEAMHNKNDLDDADNNNDYNKDYTNIGKIILTIVIIKMITAIITKILNTHNIK